LFYLPINRIRAVPHSTRISALVAVTVAVTPGRQKAPKRVAAETAELAGTTIPSGPLRDTLGLRARYFWNDRIAPLDLPLLLRGEGSRSVQRDPSTWRAALLCELMEVLRRVALWYYARSVRRLVAGDICSIKVRGSVFGCQDSGYGAQRGACLALHGEVP
jgi:hypothetical protein